ncbi:MAG: hypothetical protein ACYCU0_08355 [Solirubrobacteraceae bacterium]
MTLGASASVCDDLGGLLMVPGGELLKALDLVDLDPTTGFR